MLSRLASLFVHCLHGDDNQGSWSGKDKYIHRNVNFKKEFPFSGHAGRGVGLWLARGSSPYHTTRTDGHPGAVGPRQYPPLSAPHTDLPPGGSQVSTELVYHEQIFHFPTFV